MTPKQALAFVERHGAVLQSARGAIPSLAEAVAGGPIRGSWWGHAKNHEIFRAVSAVADSPDVLVCKIAGGKITFVHRRLWPPLVRLAGRYPKARLAWVREEHTPSGAHRMRRLPFPRWVPAGVIRAAGRLSDSEAETLLGALLPGAPKRR